MTRHEFLMACGEALIDPGIALENDELRDALCCGDDAEVLRIITEDF
jgi:hypothetical protein